MLSPILLFNFTEFLEKDDELLEESDYRNATFYASAMVGLAFAQHVFVSFNNYREFKFSANTMRALKIMVFNKNFRMSSTGKKEYNFAQTLSIFNSSGTVIGTIH